MAAQTLEIPPLIAVRSDRFLAPDQMVEMFPGLTVNALAQWRKYDVGPGYLPLGRRVVYVERLVDDWANEHYHHCRPDIRDLRPFR